MTIRLNQSFWIASLTLALLLLAAGPLFAAPKKNIANPDFTNGEKIPEGADHDWNLGATGARGWMYSNKLTTLDARQIYITRVHEGSPADGVLQVGDVLLGVAGDRFSYDPRTEMGKALTEAEKHQNHGLLRLIRWRDGKTQTVALKLPVLGSYSATAPYDCPKSKLIFERGCKALAKRVAAPNYRQNAITRSLNALALLASEDPEYLPLVRKEARWAANYSSNSFQTWWYGYVITFLAEYVMQTGDESVMPGLRRLAMEAANGQSIVGSWGHKFAGDDGRLLGYGMMNAPGVPLTTSLILAREAGVKDPKLDQAIERSVDLLRFYVGKGCIPYGDHGPWMQTHDDNGKNGMAAVMFNLLGDREATTYYSRMSVASHGAERDTGHTGNFWNMTWALPGVAQSGRHATGAWMNEFGAWYFDLARRWDGSFLHQGPPQPRGDKTKGWDATGAYLLAYAIGRDSLHLTGSHMKAAPQVDAATAQSLVEDGRGWNNKDRNSFYDKLSEKQLMARLSSWSPVVRARAAAALKRRGSEVVSRLIKMLDTDHLHSRYGACQALKTQGGRAASAVPALRKTLRAEDLWLRILAAEALAAIGEPAKVAVPQMLNMLTRHDVESDSRNMQQRYLCFALFDRRRGLIGKSVDGVDRELLLQAVRAGLQNQDGRARGSIGSVYENLSFEQIKPLLPAIHQAIVEPAPSGIMFADGIRLSCLDLLAEHHVREGMPLTIEIMDIDRWGKRHRINRCLKALQSYGGAARPMLPRLAELEKQLQAHREAKGLQPQIDLLREIIAAIKSDENPPKLRSIHRPGAVLGSAWSGSPDS